jgi:uncharacterized iron-regulated membrane protein
VQVSPHGKMAHIRLVTRRAVKWAHVWLGLAAGTLILLLGVTGGIAVLRPQVATLLSPSAANGACLASVDWNSAEREVQVAAGSAINRIYFPESTVTRDFRVHFRMNGDGGKIFKHVIYDACAGKVLGFANLNWMDWTIDLHHNLLLSEATGRYVVGATGAATLISAATGLLYWMLAGGTWKSRFTRLIGYRPGQSGFKTTLDLHRVFGLAACGLLAVGAFTGLCVCFPQNTRAAIVWMTGVTISGRGDVRAPRAKSKSAPAGLDGLILSAQRAIPRGTLREIRFPDAGGPIQIRMKLPGDFRSTGNNVVSLDRAAKVTAVDLYAGKPFANRFYQSMMALHDGEWGGPAYRGMYAGAGFASALLTITGVFLWWVPRRGRPGVKN